VAHSITNMCMSMFERYASAIATPSHGGVVFSNKNQFLKKNSLSKRFFRRFKRDILMVITLQVLLVKPRIPKRARKILYVYLGTPNLGDSIMDLSPRVLWGEASLEVEMYTNQNIANLYSGDSSFSRIVCDPSDLGKHYDFIILQSYSLKCLRFKWRYFPCAEFSTLYGHYYGCEFNRIAFAAHAWRFLLDMPKGGLSPMRPIFNLGFLRRERNRTGQPRIAVAIGGIVDWRIYFSWADVMTILDKNFPDITWVLLGSDNGVTDVEKLVSIYGSPSKIKNYVGKLSLQDVVAELEFADMLLAADGGLLNIGRTTCTPIVGLFARDIHPLMRFDFNDQSFAIHASNSVNEISPQLICEAAIGLLSGLSNSITAKYLASEPECN
jgi:hypothetical protein